MTRVPLVFHATAVAAILLAAVSSLAYSGSIEMYALNVLPANATLSKVTAQPATYQGRAALRVEFSEQEMNAPFSGESSTFVIIPTDFANGEIEVDLLGKLNGLGPPEARAFVGMAFRINSDASQFESFFLRPTNGRADDPIRRQRAVQYISFPDWRFDRLRREAPGQYEAGADIGPDEWIRVRVVVEGDRARLYVNDAAQPALSVDELKLGPNARGAIGLWAGIGTEAYFSNLRITHE